MLCVDLGHRRPRESNRGLRASYGQGGPQLFSHGVSSIVGTGGFATGGAGTPSAEADKTVAISTMFEVVLDQVTLGHSSSTRWVETVVVEVGSHGLVVSETSICRAGFGAAGHRAVNKLSGGRPRSRSVATGS